MSGDVTHACVASGVCALLQSKRQEIQEEYVRVLRDEIGPHYSLRPVEELRDTTRSSVAAYFAILCADDWGPMESFVEEIAERRFPLRFPLSEVQKAFAAFRDICVPCLTEQFRGEKLDTALAILDRTVDRAINLFSDTYQRLHLEEIRKTADELAEAHRRLQAQYEEVAEAARIKSQFFANMSHELRSPMNSIIGYTELLLDGIDGPVAPEQRQSLLKILANSRYLLKLINDVLDLSKIEAGKVELQPRPFDVSELVREAFDAVEPLAFRKRLALRSRVAEDVGVVTADTDKLKQVLINLFSNAVKFTAEGEVVCSVRRDGDQLTVDVTDTGIGIRPEDQERIFHKFFQVESALGRDHKGSGLGLPLSRMLVELMGGRLEVESEPGKGSRFTFTVPELRVAPGPGEAPSREGGRPRVLVIEDDPSALELLRKLIEAAGMEVLVASGGTEGLQAARRERPSVVTLDLLMPHVDGWQVLAELKADPETRSIPVVIVSCLDRREEGLRRGAAAFVVKPIVREDFIRTLRLVTGAGSGAAP
ncbi:MAG: response regulator [Deltaproteobacteria bacterium]|nr:response regulator [Deltaproteobacteria bacterium]